MKPSAKERVRETAQRILSGDIGPIEGCRAITNAAFDMSDEDRDDPDVLFIRGIESETDAYPLGAVRDRWDPEALAERDRRLARYLSDVEEDLAAACRSIVKKFQ